MRTWTVMIPAPCAWLTSNVDRHRYDRAGLVRQWREAVVTVARAERLPTGLGRVRIDIVFQFAGRAPVRDRLNLAPTVKAVGDGLGPAREFSRKTRSGVRHYRVPGYGLIPDDDDRHLDGPHWTIGDPLPARAYGPAGRLTLTITELEALTS